MEAAKLPLNLNQRALNSLDGSRPEFSTFKIDEHRLPSGAIVLDFGTRHGGTIGGGLLLARALTADLAQINLSSMAIGSVPYWPAIQVNTDWPLLACIASQYAGWHVQQEGYFAIGSGPARLLRGREELLTQYQLTERSSRGLVSLETHRLPGDEIMRGMAEECEITADHLVACVARTASLPGSVQIVARSVEAAMHKLHELGFDLRRVHAAVGLAPLPPPASDDLQAIGWTNDSILYGSHVAMWIAGDASEIQHVSGELCSQTSRDFGRPFLDIFEQYDREFYRIDKLLFSPGQVTLFAVDSGETFSAGAIH
ncbi:MAG TPA: methenyltetrahydromethanopterin cyclohydrolase, partial [Pirellulaceae bacterium]|nr:methenyltetrahydromethanopterin cyclohydrolase [Pirellulaceae bacterium]